MRAKRAKQYRKLMKAYEVSFNFREPYQILLDAPMILAAHRFKMHLGRMLSTTLSGTIKPMITQCCIRHLYNLQTTDEAGRAEKDSCIEVAKAAERRRCGHHELEEPLGALECLLSVVDPKGSGTNRHRYVVASQDPEVRARLREVAGVPLIYINRSVMILEPLAGKTEEVRERDEKSKIRAGLKGGRSGQGNLKRKRDDGEEEATEATGAQAGSTDAPARSKKRAKGPKQPNPLSVMRSKKKPIVPQAGRERDAVAKAAKRGEVPDGNPPIADAAVVTKDTNGAQVKRRRKRRPKESTAVEADSD